MMENCEKDGNLEEVKYISNGNGDVQQYFPKGKEKPDTLFLYFTIIIGLLPLVAGGCQLVWISSALPSLLSNNTEINPLEEPATTADISLMIAVPASVSLIAPLFLTKLSYILGRKLCLQISAAIFFISNIWQALCTRPIYIFISRTIIMLSFNLYAMVVPVYISEVCELHNRAKFMCLMSLCLPVGYIFAYWFGPILTYRIYTHILSIPLLPFLLLFFFVPETPVYLLQKEKKEECKKALKKLRSNKTPKELEIDFSKLIENFHNTQSINDRNIAHLFKTKEARVAVFLTLVLAFTQHGSGIASVTTFLGPLLNQSNINLPENIMTTLTSLCQGLCVLATSQIVGRIGRRPLMISSCLGCTSSFFVWGFFYYFKKENSSVLAYIQWLPLVCVITCLVMYSLGPGPLPMAIVGEMFPADLLSSAVTFTITAQGTIAILVTSTFPLIQEAFGTYTCIWFYSTNSAIGAFLVYWLLPETKGKTAAEVQDKLRNF